MLSGDAFRNIMKNHIKNGPEKNRFRMTKTCENDVRVTILRFFEILEKLKKAREASGEARGIPVITAHPGQHHLSKKLVKQIGNWFW